jgi:DNA invertase Pin-like site-specific DNA recombinase
MNGQRIGYVRVSSNDQNPLRQLENLVLYRLFIEKASGKDLERPQLIAMIDFIREGDVLFVHSLDRLARNLDDLRKTVKKITDKGVEVHFIKEGLIFNGKDSSIANLMLSVLTGNYSRTTKRGN